MFIKRLSTMLAVLAVIGAIVDALAPAPAPAAGPAPREPAPAPHRLVLPAIARSDPTATPAVAVEAQAAPTASPAGTIESIVFGALDRTSREGGAMTPEEFAALMAYVGVPAEWRADMLTIAECESRLSPAAWGDGGQSLGILQLWRGWPQTLGLGPVDLFDPVVNVRVGWLVRERRGRWGGAGGWTCADLRGIW